MPSLGNGLRRAVTSLAAATLVALTCACSSGGGSSPTEAPNGTWSARFDAPSDGDGFSDPSSSDTGGCSRSVEDGAAVYRRTGGGPAEGSVRCYPVQMFAAREGGEWRHPLTGGFRFDGRFRVTLADPSRIDASRFLSLATFLVAPPGGSDGGEWTGLVTVNLEWDAAAHALRVNLFHVPGHGEGEYRRVDRAHFPMNRWVRLGVRWHPDDRIELLQDGRVVIEARKRTGDGGDPIPPGELYAVHFGGYADASLHAWTITNDDLEITAPLRR